MKWKIPLIRDHTDLPSMMVMTSLALIFSLSGSSKSCRALMSVGIVYRCLLIRDIKTKHIRNIQSKKKQNIKQNGPPDLGSHL